MKFSEFDLNQDLLKGIDKAGFKECMEVQERTLEHTLAGRDVFVQSQTGSGKTAAFLVTIFELFHRNAFQTNRAVVIVPTRELAVQIEREAKILGAYLPYQVGSFYGGVGYEEQKKLLSEDVELIVGTPGRLIDLSQSRALNFRDTSVLVVDEADRMFDMGFIPDLRKIVRKMPPVEKRMTMMYSATMNTRVWQLAWEHTNDPIEIVVNPEKLTVEEITQELYHVSKDEKINLLLGILKKEDPQNALIFSNTKHTVVEVAQRLSHNGYDAEYIIGDLPQRKRIRIIDRLKSGTLRFLVATDVAARGLHIDDLDMVINYDLPEDAESYVHRIGRTARAGRTGKAVSFACERFVYGLEAIQELIDTQIPVQWPDDSMFAEDKSAGMRIERHSYDRDKRSGGDGRRSRRPDESRRGGSRSGSRGRSRTRSDSDGGRPAPRTVPSAEPAGRSEDRPSSVVRSNERPAAQRKRTSKEPQSGGPRSSGQKKQGRDDGVSRDQSMKDRLAYYRKKYGEDFEVTAGSGNASSGNASSGTASSGTAASGTKKPSGRGKVSKPIVEERRPKETPAPKAAKGPGTPSGRPKKKGLRRIIGRIFRDE